MEHSEELKNNLDQTANMEEIQAGKKLTDDEVGEAAGGVEQPKVAMTMSQLDFSECVLEVKREISMDECKKPQFPSLSGPSGPSPLPKREDVIPDIIPDIIPTPSALQ